MKKQLFIYTTLIMFTGLLCFFIASVYSTHTNNRRMAEDAVVEAAKIYATVYSAGYCADDSDLSAFTGAGGNTRISVISSDGTVIADSHPIDLSYTGTHLDRPEIIAAANGSPVVHIRYSSTLGVYFLYYALKVYEPDGGYVFIRTAVPIADINAYLSESMPMLLLIFLAITALCFALSRRVIGHITRPLESVRQKLDLLSNGSLMPPSPAAGFEEIDPIISGIDDIAHLLQDSMRELANEKNKVEYILDNISDGIFAVNSDKDIILINNAALRVFDVTKDITGKSINYLTYDKTLLDAVNDCTGYERGSLAELSQNGRTYLLTVKPLENSALTMVVMTDVTESRENARQREEFFENASHELKTPLTAIKGFNELCMLHGKDENIRKYIDAITRETDRMLTLIGDMLKLSELSSAQTPDPVDVNMRDAATEVQEILAPLIKEKDIDFSISGDCVIAAEPRHIFDLLKNLVENALRYNTQGGSVTVVLAEGSLNVSDTGIGIAPEAQARLFERFYRVEKSRSIQSGGTGLGLAIVKHICNLYGWELSLRSRPGIGTDVTVMF